MLALFPIAQLACDGNTEPEPGTGGIRFTIGVMVDLGFGILDREIRQRWGLLGVEA